MHFVLHALILSTIVSFASFAADELSSRRSQISDSDAKKDLGKQLLRAAYEGDSKTIRNILDSGCANLPLTRALVQVIIKNDDENFSIFLEEYKAPVNEEVEDSAPLAYAAHLGCTKFVKKLLEAGAQLHATSCDGSTALHLACLNGHCDTAMALKNAGALTTALDHDKASPLHCAAFSGNKELVQELLLDAKETWDTKDLREATPLAYALNQCHEEVGMLLFDKGANLNTVDTSGNTPLHYAACFSEKLVTRLLNQKVTLTLNRNQRTPLHKAALHGQKNIIKLLIPFFEIDAQDKWGDTPLLTAIWGNQYQSADLLIRKGADINLANLEKITPLHAATINNDFEMVDILLDNGANLFAEDFVGKMPLFYADRNHNMWLHLANAMLKETKTKRRHNKRLRANLP